MNQMADTLEVSTDKCLMQFVQAVVKLVKCLLNHKKVGQFIAESVIGQEGDKLFLRPK